MFPDHAVRRAKSPDAHLLGHNFPRIHGRVQHEGVRAGFAVETEGVDVVEDEVALGGLVELEFDDLGAVLVAPLVGYLGN